MEFCTYRDLIIDKTFKTIYFCIPKNSLHLKTYQKTIKKLQEVCGDSLEVHEGLMNFDAIKETDHDHILVICDDLGGECFQNEQVRTIFIKNSHHKRVSFVFSNQHFFGQSKDAVEIRRNASHFVLFHNRSDRRHLQDLSHKFSKDGDKLSAIFNWMNYNYEAKDLKYCIVDNTSNSNLPGNLMLRSNIFPYGPDKKIQPIFFMLKEF